MINRGTTYWLSNRRMTQRAATNTLPAPPAIDVPLDLIRGWSRIVPSGVILGMILLAALGICSTVIMRTRVELQESLFQYQAMASDVTATRRTNDALRLEINRMTSDPATIESAARNRLGMVRASDVVVPVRLIPPISDLNSLSSVR